ncbi:MAG: hypothetical protein Q9P90_02260 [candidate division KSB1 bacterium]|nr:hypothetical protein [candidate division KSB1 bacterium]
MESVKMLYRLGSDPAQNADLYAMKGNGLNGRLYLALKDHLIPA